MSMTKSESAAAIVNGLGIESFHHETLGHFNITALREMIKRDQPEEYRCSFESIRMVDGIQRDAIEYLVGSREIDYGRCAELTTEQLHEPLIFLACPPGSNGEQASQLLVDGIHRLAERRRRGYSWFDFYLIPLSEAPLVDPSELVDVPWGDMDLVPGKGLVKRNGS